MKLSGIIKYYEILKLALQTAAENQNSSQLQKVIASIISKEFGITSSIQNPQNTVLIAATESGEKQFVISALNNNADVNVLDDTTQRTPLNFAAKNGYEQIVALLLQRRADVYKTGDHGEVPVTEAIWNNHTNILPLFFPTKMYINQPLTISLSSPLSSFHKDMHHRAYCYQIHKDSKKIELVPLHFAITIAITKPEVIAMLLKLGANPNFKCYDYSPLKMAILTYAKAEILSLLIEAGADIHEKWIGAINFIQFAICSHNNVAIEILLSKFISQGMPEDNKNTLLIYSYLNNNKPAALLLVKNGANPYILCPVFRG